MITVFQSFAGRLKMLRNISLSKKKIGGIKSEEETCLPNFTPLKLHISVPQDHTVFYEFD